MAWNLLPFVHDAFGFLQSLSQEGQRRTFQKEQKESDHKFQKEQAQESRDFQEKQETARRDAQNQSQEKQRELTQKLAKDAEAFHAKQAEKQQTFQAQESEKQRNFQKEQTLVQQWFTERQTEKGFAHQVEMEKIRQEFAINQSKAQNFQTYLNRNNITPYEPTTWLDSQGFTPQHLQDKLCIVIATNLRQNHSGQQKLPYNPFMNIQKALRRLGVSEYIELIEVCEPIYSDTEARQFYQRELQNMPVVMLYGDFLGMDVNFNVLYAGISENQFYEKDGKIWAKSQIGFLGDFSLSMIDELEKASQMPPQKAKEKVQLLIDTMITTELLVMADYYYSHRLESDYQPLALNFLEKQVTGLQELPFYEQVQELVGRLVDFTNTRNQKLAETRELLLENKREREELEKQERLAREKAEKEEQERLEIEEAKRWLIEKEEKIKKELDIALKITEGFKLCKEKKHNEGIKILEYCINNHYPFLEERGLLDKIFQRLGESYFFEKNSDKAIYYFQKFINKNPSDGDTWVILGGSYLNKKNYEKAIESCEKALNIGFKETLARQATYKILYEAYSKLAEKNLDLAEKNQYNNDKASEHYTKTARYYFEKAKEVLVLGLI